MNLKMLKDFLVNFCQLSGVKYPNLRFLYQLPLSGGTRGGARGPSPPPPLSQGLDDRGSPLSEELDTPLLPTVQTLLFLVSNGQHVGR